MEWKYKVIFLLVLLTSALSERLNAQYCLDFKYDESGNRIEMFAHNCGAEYKELSREVVGIEKISEEILSEGLLVYPNPTEGVFVVNLKDDEMGNAVYQVFNATGILIQEGKCTINHEIDISDNPAGMYLLRIIKGDSMYSCVVLKL